MVISACLQDAVTRGSAMRYLPKQRRFALLFNRFMWEDQFGDRTATPARRIRAGVHFNSVLSVQSRGFEQDGGDVLQLLSLVADKGEDEGATIHFEFAGGGSARLAVECVDCYLSDQDGPWRARRKPEHDWKD